MNCGGLLAPRKIGAVKRWLNSAPPFRLIWIGLPEISVFMVLLLWQCFFHQWRYLRRKRQWRRDLSEMRTPKQWWGQR